MYIATLRLFFLILVTLFSIKGFSSDSKKKNSKRSIAALFENPELYDKESDYESSDDEEVKELKRAKKRIKISNELLEGEIKSAELRIKKIRKEQELQKFVITQPSYTSRPYNSRTKTLIISDRKISLDGPINRHITDLVIRKINFYNYKHKSHPIFLFITSPGGSVIQGFKLLDAINTSNAPVYVIVKEFAASMAAVITAQAKHSFALENAIILHHEPSTISYGNTSILREGVQFIEEIETRLVSPLLKKFGYSSLEAWRQDLYKHSVTGDWTEFGNNAYKLKWVNNIVKEIRDFSSTCIDEESLKEKICDHDEEDKHKEQKSSDTNVYKNPFDINFIYQK